MTIRNSILSLLESGPATHEEIARKLDKPAGTIRRQTQELRRVGLIVVDSYVFGSTTFSLRKPEYVYYLSDDKETKFDDS